MTDFFVGDRCREQKTWLWKKACGSVGKDSLVTNEKYQYENPLQTYELPSNGYSLSGPTQKTNTKAKFWEVFLFVKFVNGFQEANNEI